MKKEKKPARATLPKSALARLLFIDRKIASGTFPNQKRLAQEWESISIITIGRDIETMKDMFDAPIEYSALNRGYYYSDPNYRFLNRFSGADELLAIGMAKNILSLYKDTPVFDMAQNLLNSITAPYAAEDSSHWYENRIVIPQVPSSPIPPDAWNPITSALRENRVLTFDYLGAFDEDYKPRRVRPYQLLFDNGLWYLYSYSEERKDIRLFSLCRMKKIVLAKDRFSLPANFDYRANSAGSYFGVFAGQKKTRFKIAFYDYSIVWVKDRKWADDQKFTGTKDEIIIGFTSTQFEKVLEWVLSRGCTALPLEPKSLVDKWRQNIDEMRKMSRRK